MKSPKRLKGTVIDYRLSSDILGEIISFLEPDAIRILYDLYKRQILTTANVITLAKVYVPTYFPDVLSLFVEFKMNGIMDYILQTSDDVSDMAIVYAASCNNIHALDTMLKDNRFDVSYNDYAAVIEAVHFNNINALKTFIRNDVDLSHVLVDIISIACEHDYVGILKLLKDSMIAIPTSSAIIAVNHTSIKSFSFLLTLCSDDDLHHLLIYICQYAHVYSFLVDTLQAITAIDEETVSTAFLYACASGFTDAVNVFGGYIQLAVFGGQALILASAHNHTKIVEQLLPYIKATIRNNEPLLNAVKNNNVDMINLILKDPNVNPANNFNDPFVIACQYGALDAVMLLAAHPKVDPTARDYDGFQRACEYDNVKIVKYLIDKKIAPSKYSHAFMLSLDVVHSLNNAELIELLETYFNT